MLSLNKSDIGANEIVMLIVCKSAILTRSPLRSLVHSVLKFLFVNCCLFAGKGGFLSLAYFLRIIVCRSNTGFFLSISYSFILETSQTEIKGQEINNQKIFLSKIWEAPMVFYCLVNYT